MIGYYTSNDTTYGAPMNVKDLVFRVHLSAHGLRKRCLWHFPSPDPCCDVTYDTP